MAKRIKYIVFGRSGEGILTWNGVSLDAKFEAWHAVEKVQSLRAGVENDPDWEHLTTMPLTEWMDHMMDL